MDHQSPFSDCPNCLCFASRRAARSVTAVYDHHLRPHGLHGPQFTILSMLALAGPTPLGTVAKWLGMDRTTLTRNFTLLQTKGWAQRRDDDNDARTQLLSITPKGREVARSALPAWRKAQDTVAAAFGAAGVAAIHRLANTQIAPDSISP